jgi:hypothetical protein
MELHLLWVFLAGLGAFVVYMAIGTILFVALPGMKVEFKKYPGVYRGEEDMKKTMPFAMLSVFVSTQVLALLYAHMTTWGTGLIQGLCFGVMIGVFVLSSNVLHNYVILNIGFKLTWQSGIAYFCEWVMAGITIGLIYH